jgi:uncharacterized protein (DUF1501 family)
MERRQFVKTLAALPLAGSLPPAAADVPASPYRRLLVLIELKGGNDGLNTLVPYADQNYHALRPQLAVARDQVLQLDERMGLHPALEPLLGLWRAGELAIVQGIGYPGANLSHFRSIEIWDTASRTDQYLEDGWLSRTFRATPPPRAFAADGVVIGGHDLGPLAGTAARVIALADTDRFLRQARLAAPMAREGNLALRHILRVERDIAQAAAGLNAGRTFAIEFPKTVFGSAVRTASQVIAAPAGVAVVKLSLNGFDTHSNQAATHARLLQTLAEGLTALRGTLVELGRWDSTLVMTYAEFGRRARQNASSGTDHGTASVHFVAGGRVKGGLYGAMPALDRLDGTGNLPFAVDFRSLYATVLERWWQVDSAGPLNGRFQPLELLRA